MNNGDMPASPITSEPYPMEAMRTNLGSMPTGLTKREAFAMAAMQGMLASGKFAIEHCNLIEIAERSYKQADLMLFVGGTAKEQGK